MSVQSHYCTILSLLCMVYPQPSTVQGDTKTFFQFLKGSKGATPTCAPPEVHGDKGDPEEKQQLDREAGGVQGVPARGKGSGQA